MKKRYLLYFAFLIFSFFSCSNLFYQNDDSDSSLFVVASGTIHVPNNVVIEPVEMTKTARFVVSTARITSHAELDSASINEIPKQVRNDSLQVRNDSLQVRNDSLQVRNDVASRQAFPSAASGTLYYTLTCTNGTATYDGTVDSSALTFSVQVPLGSSTINVEAFLDSDKTQQIYEGTLPLSNVTSSSDLSNQTITLNDIQSGTDKTATVSLPITISSDVTISKITAAVSTSSTSTTAELSSVTSGTTYYFTLSDFVATAASSANAVPGVYDVVFDFYALDSSSNEYLAFQTNQKISASNYLSTSTWTGNGSDSCINSSGIFEITKTLCDSFLATTFYIDSTNGSDTTASGSFSSPFKTIQKAVNVIKSRGTTDSCTIYLKTGITASSSDDFTNGSLVEIADSANVNLKLKSYPASSTFTIDAANLGRIFYVGSGNTLSIQNLTLQNGYSATNGGAIYNKGTLTILSKSTLTLNSALSNGGAIYNEGTATVSGTLSYNLASTSGAGIYNSGTLTLDGCAFITNTATATATATATGGAVYSTKSFTVSGKTTATIADAVDDFYLDNTSGTPAITLSSDFLGTSGTLSARISLASYSEDYQVLSGDGVSETNCGYFSLSDENYSIGADGKLDKAGTVYSSWSLLSSAISDGLSSSETSLSYRIADISDFNNSTIALSGSSKKVSIVSAKDCAITIDGTSVTSFSSAYFTASNITATIGSEDHSITIGDSSIQSTKNFISYIDSDANLSIINCIFQNLKANNAIDSEGTLLLKNCEFKNITPSTTYGTIYVEGGTTTIDTCKFTSCDNYDVCVGSSNSSSSKLVLKGTLSDTNIYIKNSSSDGIVTFDTSLSLASGAAAKITIESYDSSAALFASSDGNDISETIRNYFTVTDSSGNFYTINADGTLSQKVSATSLSSISSYSDLKSGGTYSISTEDELNKLATLCNSGDSYAPFDGMTILLEKDLALTCDSSNPFTPIGTYKYTFAGIFNGQNHKISNLYVNSSDQAGLFAALNGGGIKNLTVEGTVISTTGSNATSYGTGGIVGLATDVAVIENCVSNVNVTGGDRANIGGICGYATKSVVIRNCVNIGNVTSSVEYAGGILGRAVSSSTSPAVYNCANFGTINGTSNVGGICGSTAGDVSLCYNVGSVSSSDSSSSVAAIANVTGTDSSYYSSCFYLSGSASSGFEGTSTVAASFTDVSTLKSDLTSAVSSSSYSENCNSWSNYTYTFNSVNYPVCVNCGN